MSGSIPLTGCVRSVERVEHRPLVQPSVEWLLAYVEAQGFLVRVSTPGSGEDGTRTHNRLLAKQLRYQLRHIPEEQTAGFEPAHPVWKTGALPTELRPRVPSMGTTPPRRAGSRCRIPPRSALKARTRSTPCRSTRGPTLGARHR